MNKKSLWNGPAGHAWVDHQPLLDRIFEPFTALLVEATRPSDRVLDVGCGTGGTTLAVARRADAAIGVDVSEPMLALARERAAKEGSRASFVHADAATHAFEPARFDLLVSRFGVMFFADPVAAFANLRRAATADARLALIAFRSPAENAFMTTAERAAAPLVPNIPPRRTDGPGQFAFADEARVKTIFASSGWGAVAMEAIDVTCTFPESALVGYLTRLGPLGLVLQRVEEARRAEIVKTVRGAFDPYVVGERGREQVRFTAACWMIRRASEASEES
jgi:SAM-dependent methyltransferase